MSEAKPVEGGEEEIADPIERAAFWHGLFEEGGEVSPALRDRFEQWLKADPCHRKAYQAIEHSWTGMASTGVHERILSMRHEALAAPKSWRSRRVLPAAIAASVLLASLVMIGHLVYRSFASFDPSDREFATQVGQRSTIALSDGSNVVLNTSSRIRVAFDEHLRRVQLLAGEAWFEVAKGQTRPFVVEAGDRRVTAHGTAFDVRLEDHDQIQVTLVEGKVSVEPLQGLNRPNFDLIPGEQLVIAQNRPAAKLRADLAKATSWREGQIIFDDDTLASAVAEMNRYSVKKIVLADSRLTSLRMSGVFVAGHTESFIETVTGHFPIRAAANSEGDVVLTSAQ